MFTTNHYPSFIKHSFLALATLFCIVSTVWSEPYILNDCDVQPEVIWKKGLGRTPDVAEGRIRIRAFGDTLSINLPLDVIMVTDNSGSMKYRYPGYRDVTNPTRIQGTYNACVNFIDDFLDTNDRIGHLRFCAKVDTPSLFSAYDAFDDVQAKMDTTINGNDNVFNGVTYGGTSIWMGIYTAVEYAMENRRPGNIPIIIALTDGEDNGSGRYGLPTYEEHNYGWRPGLPDLGASQRDAVDSVIDLISSYNDSVRVYTINLGSVTNQSYMQEIAEASRGDWAYSEDGSDMDQVFQGIGSRILRAAAVEISNDSAMILDVFPPYIDYVPDSWVRTANNTASVDSVIARTVDSLTVLQFFVNEINVDETFEVSYRLQSNKAGRQYINYGIDKFNAQGLHSQVQYKDYLGVRTIVDSLATRYIFVMDTILTDAFSITATATDTDRVMIDFNLVGAENMLLNTFYLFWDTTNWVTTNTNPDMVINADSLKAWGGKISVAGLAADTRYFFTIAGRNYFGELSSVDVAMGDTAKTFKGQVVANINIVVGNNVAAGESLVVTITATDASGNPIAIPTDLVWDLPDGITATMHATGTGTFYYVPTGLGSGSLIVSSPLYAVSDTSSVITIGVGSVQTLEIGPFSGDTLVMFLDEYRAFSVTGYDRFGNSAGLQQVNWDTTGNLAGNFTGLGSSTGLTYSSNAPGTGYIIISRDGIRDSVFIKVVNERVATVRILWPNMTPVGATTVTSDDDSTLIKVYAYNSNDSLLGAVTVDWAFTNTAVGYPAEVVGSTASLIFRGVGQSRVTAVYQNGIRDTSGIFTVVAGAMASLIIVPADAYIYLDDTLTFSAKGLDADGNQSSLGAVTWTGPGHSGIINAAGRYIPSSLGIDTVFASSAGFNATAHILVLNRPGYFYLRPEHTVVSVGEVVACTLVVHDYTGAAYSDSSIVTFAYDLKLEPLSEDGDSLIPAEGVCKFTISGTQQTGLTVIPADTPLPGGRFVFSVLYDLNGEALFVRCTDSTLNITATTEKGIVWLDPEILSHVYAYPSPVDFNRSPLHLEYRMRYDGKVTIRILNAMGSLAYEKIVALGDEGARSGRNSMTWDGMSRHGKPVGSGAFLVRIFVETPSGNMEQVKKVGVIGKK